MLNRHPIAVYRHPTHDRLPSPPTRSRRPIIPSRRPRLSHSYDRLAPVRRRGQPSHSYDRHSYDRHSYSRSQRSSSAQDGARTNLPGAFCVHTLILPQMTILDDADIIQTRYLKNGVSLACPPYELADHFDSIYSKHACVSEENHESAVNSVPCLSP